MSAVDFSSGAFNPAQHYSSVSLQQGHVQLDADSSEDSEANSEKIRRLTAETTMSDGDLALQNAVTPLTPGDPAPAGDSTAATVPSALAGLEPMGGLHLLADDWVLPRRAVTAA